MIRFVVDEDVNAYGIRTAIGGSLLDQREAFWDVGCVERYPVLYLI